MDLLILGGTRFVGRHLAAAALAAGHRVSLFHRGRTNPGLFAEAEHIYGDRDGGLGPLRRQAWDAVVDVSGYVPRVVGDSAELLAEAVPFYAFISTGSVYATPRPSMDENAPLKTLTDESIEVVSGETYGGLKVLCERAVRRVYPQHHLVVRPGIVAGPYDPSDRFTYWPVRLARGGEVLAPPFPDQPVQFIDARDLAAWIIHMLENGWVGTYNAVGPAVPATMRDMLEACHAAAGSEAHLTWVDPKFAVHHHLTTQALPFFVAPGRSALFTMDNNRALSAGLDPRPIVETAADTLDWALTRSERHHWQAGLDPALELDLLREWHRVRAA
jgi:2'-hydroxyisoflavone reductase